MVCLQIFVKHALPTSIATSNNDNNNNKNNNNNNSYKLYL